MKPNDFFARIVEPTLAMMQTTMDIPLTDRARVLVMTIAGQESAWRARRQIGGPARSYWQFERYGGVAELFATTPLQLKEVCGMLDIPYDPDTVYEAMAWNDTLGCTMGRLLLWQDPARLPEVGDKQTAWRYYLRNWRPGAPHEQTWSVNYDTALQAMQAQS